MSQPLPRHLRAALGKGHADPDVWRLVTQFEAFGHPVRVIRIQLGDVTSDDCFRKTEIYRSSEASGESATLAGAHYAPARSNS